MRASHGLRPAGCRLVLCASDGVWHCMADDEAIRTVEHALAQLK
jgi:hypothetical protein